MPEYSFGDIKEEFGTQFVPRQYNFGGFLGKNINSRMVVLSGRRSNGIIFYRLGFYLEVHLGHDLKEYAMLISPIGEVRLHSASLGNNNVISLGYVRFDGWDTDYCDSAPIGFVRSIVLLNNFFVVDKEIIKAALSLSVRRSWHSLRNLNQYEKVVIEAIGGLSEYENILNGDYLRYLCCFPGNRQCA